MKTRGDYIFLLIELDVDMASTMITEDVEENNQKLHICFVLNDSKFHSLQCNHKHNINKFLSIHFFYNPTYQLEPL